MFSEARLRQIGIDVGAPRGFPSIGVVFSEPRRSLPPAGTFSGCPASASSPGTGRRCRKGRKRRGWQARRPGQLQPPCFRAFAWGPAVQGAARTADRHVRRARRAIPRGSGSRLHWQWAPLERGRFLLRLLPSWARRCAGPVPGAQPWVPPPDHARRCAPVALIATPAAGLADGLLNAASSRPPADPPGSFPQRSTAVVAAVVWPRSGPVRSGRKCG